jgi:hypothetical protein
MYDATFFLEDLAGRMANRIQLSTDGHPMYESSVRQAFRCRRGLGGHPEELRERPQPARQIQPAGLHGNEAADHQGRPGPRPDLNQLRGAPELDHAYGDAAHAVSLHFIHYNFARPDRSLKERYPHTPAMAAGVADHIWTLEEIAALLD